MTMPAKPDAAMECGDAIVQAIGEMPYQRAGEPWGDYQERLIVFLTKLWRDGRSAGLEEAAQVADRWARSGGLPCPGHDDDPCCHVRTGAAIWAAILQRKEAK